MCIRDSTEGGVPVCENGNYFLMDHGQIIRSITATEYSQFQAVEVRFFTGPLMLLSLASVIGTLVVYPKLAQKIQNQRKESFRANT